MNTTIRTFRPVLPIGKGPVSDSAEDAIHDILTDLADVNNANIDDALMQVAKSLQTILAVHDWIDGTYTLFENYAIVVETMSKERFDNMPEFCGY